MRKKKSEVQQFLGSTDPLIILKRWLTQAQKKKQLENPWAMSLSTSDGNQPSGRIVLLKYLKKDSLIFFSNYLSRKGQDLQNNPRAAATFYWKDLGRQVRIEGKVKKISRKESMAYWKTRDRESQLSQWLSRQSQPALNREILDSLKEEARKKFKNRSVPCPPHWGGYALSIKKIEFWVERKHRLHDRFLFTKQVKNWVVQRLFP